MRYMVQCSDDGATWRPAIDGAPLGMTSEDASTFTERLHAVESAAMVTMNYAHILIVEIPEGNCGWAEAVLCLECSKSEEAEGVPWRLAGDGQFCEVCDVDCCTGGVPVNVVVDADA